MPYVYNNFASTTLGSALTSASTTIQLSTGGGAQFGALSSGQSFWGVLQDAATGLLHEIVLVTGISTDTLTVSRGQQGTPALTWSVGDLFQQRATASDFGSFLQESQIPSGQLIGNPGGTLAAVSVDGTTIGIAANDLSVVSPRGEAVFTATSTANVSGSFAFPSGARFARVRAWGAGGCGGAGNGGYGAGGSGGGYVEVTFSLNTAISYPYQAAGIVQAGTGGAVTGDSTYFINGATTYNAAAGPNGNQGSSGGGIGLSGGAGGAGSNGTINDAGLPGGNGLQFNSTSGAGGAGGPSPGYVNTVQSAGAFAATAIAGQNGTFPGVGGGGGVGTASPGGYGGPGRIVVEWS